MRYLKQKIARARAFEKLRKLEEAKTTTKSPLPLRKNEQRSVQKVQPPANKPMKKKRARGNNVMKNYARAMINFALSPLAEPYKEKIAESRQITSEAFRKILLEEKKRINCITNLRNLLLVEDQDTEVMKIFKPIFQKLSEIFIKFFSVNWIYNGRLEDKFKYIQYRGKMLRRVQDPRHFTYLENFVEKKKKCEKKNF